jgi:hypothetical protein
MGNSLDKVREKIDKLIEQRDRIGKDPLTTDERIGYLNSAYDAALVYLLQCVTAGTTKSTAALCTVLERTRLEIVDLQRVHSIQDGNWRVMFDTPPEDFAESMKTGVNA